MDLSAKLRALAALDFPYKDARVRAGTRHAEVLVLFGRTGRGNTEVLYIHRAESADNKDTHAGQMAFPGGACEAGETEDPRGRAAVRETFEEVGVREEQVEILGFLPELVSITGFQVLPVVAWLKAPIDEVALRPDPREIQGTVWIPWDHLTEPSTYARETIEVGSVRYPIHVFRYEDYRIWGLTGTLTKNLLDRWQVLG